MSYDEQMEPISDEELAAQLLNDPFAAASDGAAELRDGKLRAPRKIIRKTWPHVDTQPVNADCKVLDPKTW